MLEEPGIIIFPTITLRSDFSWTAPPHVQEVTLPDKNELSMASVSKLFILSFGNQPNKQMLTQELYKHFPMIKSRNRTFCGIINSFILCRGSKYKHLAEERNDDILLDSKIKSISRKSISRFS